MTPLEKYNADEAELIARTWGVMMGTVDGRRLVYSILEECDLFAVNFHGNQRDVFDKGRQSVGSELLTKHVFPEYHEEYLQMLREARERDDHREHLEVNHPPE